MIQSENLQKKKIIKPVSLDNIEYLNVFFIQALFFSNQQLWFY